MRGTWALSPTSTDEGSCRAPPAEDEDEEWPLPCRSFLHCTPTLRSRAHLRLQRLHELPPLFFTGEWCTTEDREEENEGTDEDDRGCWGWDAAVAVAAATLEDEGGGGAGGGGGLVLWGSWSFLPLWEEDLALESLAIFSFFSGGSRCLLASLEPPEDDDLESPRISPFLWFLCFLPDSLFRLDDELVFEWLFSDLEELEEEPDLEEEEPADLEDDFVEDFLLSRQIGRAHV